MKDENNLKKERGVECILINTSFKEKILDAGSGGRTHTVLLPQNFESVAQLGSLCHISAVFGNIKHVNTLIKTSFALKYNSCLIFEIFKNKSVLVEKMAETLK